MIGAVHGGVLCACFSWAGCIEAQDRDTAFFSEGRTQTTILDDIGDRGERKAFLKMYKEHNAAARWSLAVKFPADNPASWLLAEVYEIASKACDDLDDYQCALEMGDRSLRLRPEKPLLLIPLASVQLQRGLVEKARESVVAPIDYLDRFAPPAGSRADEWSKITPELRGAGYYTLARVDSIEGLAQTGGTRTQLLEQALPAMNQAISLRNHDPELATREASC